MSKSDLYNLGDIVAYLPFAAGDDINHPSVKWGIVVGKDSRYVEVQFDDEIHPQKVTPERLRQ